MDARRTRGFSPLRLRLLVPASLTVLASATLGGATDTARQILDRAKELEETDRHWNDRFRQMSLKIVDGKGVERTRAFQFFERRYSGDERKTIVFFLGPPEVKGMGLLAHSYPNRSAEQWLYLPNLKRIRQITSQTRNESFVGSDLTYHDLDILGAMSVWTERDAASELLAEESVDGTPCHVVRLRPKRDDIVYDPIVVWIAKSDFMPRRVEFYESSGEKGWLTSVLGSSPTRNGPKKRIALKDVRMTGMIPVAHRIEVETPAAGSRTAIDVTEVGFNQQLEEDLFTHRALERGRR
jgi:hypothetical protein